MDTDFYKLLYAFRFSVEIDNVIFGFKSVRGIKIAAAFEPLQVGGMNGGPVMLPAPEKSGGRISFERGKYISPPHKLPLPGTPVGSVIITVYDHDGVCGAKYKLESPVVESVELGGLDAMSSEVLIETLTVSFRRVEEKT